ncbi:hypothetical protein [Methanobacterium spitsbergense]|uniref:Uncharacterized protein n=1 Tax=Methanobacterium spitsbergense TaxID=2874285 RepID=A0A8T5V031_9EURY|nr:hypothetical protein [Methanobacterium spitsbergense]MBZ2166339.1 hypothetical protein [Methanobacterium spitsbergense]
MREDVLKRKHQLEVLHAKWRKNPVGPPPADPRIMDWDQINRVKNDNELWTKSWKIIGICMFILVFELFILFTF